MIYAGVGPVTVGLTDVVVRDELIEEVRDTEELEVARLEELDTVLLTDNEKDDEDDDIGTLDELEVEEGVRDALLDDELPGIVAFE